MFKAVGAVFIIVCFGLFGYAGSRKLQKRVSKLIEFRGMIDKLRIEISLKNTTLPKAIQGVGTSFKNKCFLECAELISEMGGQDAFNTALCKNSVNYCFTPDDVSAISSFASGLGRCDLKSQLRQFDYAIAEIDKRINHGKSECCEKSKMYFGGSVLAGVFIVLVLL